MHIHDILRSMRDGEEQSPEAIRSFVDGLSTGEVSRPQAAAWLAWAYQRTLNHDETLALTQAMIASGNAFSWPEGPEVVDKHSTGGVGDKVSLILAPLWAELGLRVPMISGRGLGHTGGTLDKLESIPGFQVVLPDSRLAQILRETGCFMGGQTGTLAPADRVLYALRNEVNTVDSIPLIVGSILSKKLSEGLDRLVLDVKVGSGAFMTHIGQARALAQALVEVATGAGVSCSAHLTAMERPLGRAIGHTLEVLEAVECLQGGGPPDLLELTLHLADHPRAAEVLASGRAFDRFCRIIEAHGGDPRSLDGGLRGSGCREHVVLAERAGVLHALEARSLAHAVFSLGGGRSHAKDPIDHGVGLRLHAHPGEPVESGQPLITIYHRDGEGLDDALRRIATAVLIQDGPADVPPLVAESIHAEPA
ncbi:MAG: thymidine phosphorylase [Deltaproteobacteria bacterium]|nr:MAG: thymidine phosphorylase [Deltaproteobacteria bacterium]